MPHAKQDQQVVPPVRPEAELESRMAAALSAAFPNIPREQLVEQRRFTVRLGHETHEFDSAAQWAKSGRADVIVFHGGRPLAVVELKREDLALTHADYEQAQSYANQLTPRPPLVVVTNGRDTHIYDANTGQLWSSEQDAASAVARLLANAAKLAAADTSSFQLDKLVGTDPAGYAGLEDGVDWHWDRVFAGAALTTLLGIGAELAAPENRNGGDRVIIAGRDSLKDSVNQVGQEMTRRNMNMQPTLTERPGLPVRVIVNRDLVLRPYQPLFFVRGGLR